MSSIAITIIAISCLLTSVVVTPSFPRWLLFIGTLPAISLINPTTDGVFVDYLLGGAIVAFVLTASDLILLSQPQRELRWIRQKETAIEAAALGARVRWGLRLLSSARGVGWSHHQPGSIFHPDVPPEMSRLSFLARKIPTTFLWAVNVELSALYIMHCPTVTDGVPFAARPWHGKLVDMFFWILVIQSNAEPKDWSSAWGYWRDAYTVRRFWGRTWHQWLRKFLIAHGKFVARRVLCLKAESNAAFYVQLYTAFFLSGVIHCAGEYAVGIPWSKSGCMRFFLLQALAITIEDGVIAMGVEVGIHKDKRLRVVGYAWVLLWFYRITESVRRMYAVTWAAKVYTALCQM